MSRPRLLEALERTLAAKPGDGFGHHLPPAEGQVVTANPLTQQGIGHLYHFDHQDGANPADDTPAEIDRVVAEDVTDKESANEPTISLLKRLGGKSGESLKSDATSATYLLPPASEAVVNGGKGGQSPETGSTLLAHLRHALSPVPSPPVSDAVLRHDRLNRWLTQHPPPACPPNQCAHCGGQINERAKDAVPVLRSLRPPEAIWLHLTCSYAWYEQRLASAAADVANQLEADGVGP